MWWSTTSTVVVLVAMAPTTSSGWGVEGLQIGNLPSIRRSRFSRPSQKPWASTLGLSTDPLVAKTEETEVDTDRSKKEDHPGPFLEFVTPPMQVYIEDTDAFGIMYNSNYLRAFDRALHLSTKPNNATAKKAIPGVSCQHEGWSIVKVGKQRFAAAADFGEDYVVEGRLKSISETSSLEVWEMAMKSVDGSVVYNTVQDLYIAKPEDASSFNSAADQDRQNSDPPPTGSIYSVTHPPPFDMDKIRPTFRSQNRFVVYRDEIDAHWQGHLPLRNVLNLFERSRSNALGGPNGLRRLQHPDDGSHGILVVVTGVSDLTLLDEGGLLVPGQEVVVDTAFCSKRKGMFWDCYQTLHCSSSSSSSSPNGPRLAQGKVSMLMVDATTRAPTAQLPDWLRTILGEPAKPPPPPDQGTNS